MRKHIASLSLLLILLAASSLSAADLYGYLADKAGKPLTIKVELRDAAQKPAGAPVTTDAKGYYAFKEIKPGMYEILAGGKVLGKVFVGPGETRQDFRVQ